MAAVLPVRQCGRCGSLKPLTDFYTKTRGYGKRVPDTVCKACHAVRAKSHKTAHLAVIKARKHKWYQERGRFVTRDLSYRRTYNSTQEAYDLQLTAQDDRCAICRRARAEGERNFAFDHDHETGLTRGVLCAACNGGLGCFRDNPTALRTAITYLIAWAEIHEQDQKKAQNE